MIRRTAPWLGLLMLSQACTSAADFVGRETCTGCHAEQEAQWKGSHHDLAMQVASQQTVLADFGNTTFTHNGITSTFSRRGDEFWVRTDGPDGELEDFQITHTFGIEPLQQYLIDFAGGRLQALSICWDTRPADEGGQRWFHLYPDESIDSADVLHWTGLLQNWNQMCAECHSTDLHKNYDPVADSYSTTFEEIDVSCEACHGPGSDHVQWADEGAVTGTDPRLQVDYSEPLNQWLINRDTGLARRDPPRTAQREVESCGRCHSRRSVLTDDYVYGQPLMATHRPALLTPGLYHADGQIQDEVYVYGSFLQSKMYAAGVTCSDCHNPHSLELTGSGDGLCTACHLEAKFDSPQHHHHPRQSQGASCIACHMPAKNYMEVDPRRDHSFRVPRPDLSLSLGVPDVCTGCHIDQTLQWAAATVQGWRNTPAPAHFATALGAARASPRAAVEPLLALVSNPSQPAIARATALEMLPRSAAGRIPSSLEQALKDPSPAVRRAALTAISRVDPAERLKSAAPLLGDDVLVVRIEAARVLANVDDELWGDIQRVAQEAALEEFRTAQRVSLDRPEASLNLGLLEAELGNFEEAERHYRRALKLSGSFVPAYVNLADLYRQQDRDPEAEQLLRQAFSRLPDNAELAHTLGLTLVRLQRHQEALPLLEQAAGIRPEVARYQFVLAAALQSRNRFDEALATTSTALETHRSNPDLLSLAMNLSMQLKRPEEALSYARRLQALFPRDVRLAGIVRRLESTVAGRQ